MVKRIIFTIIFSISTFFIFSSQKEIKDNNYLNVSKYNDDIYKISYIDPYYGYMAMGIFGIIFIPTGHGVIIGGVFLGFNAFIYLYAKAMGNANYNYYAEDEDVEYEKDNSSYPIDMYYYGYSAIGMFVLGISLIILGANFVRYGFKKAKEYKYLGLLSKRIFDFNVSEEEITFSIKFSI